MESTETSNVGGSIDDMETTAFAHVAYANQIPFIAGVPHRVGQPHTLSFGFCHLFG